MASGDQSFYSTPAFEIFRRGLTTQTVKKFRGIDVWKNITAGEPDHAQDCLNVMVNGAGGLSKFRLPVKVSPATGSFTNGPQGFWDFQQANGTRQIVANFAASLYYFTGDGTSAGTLIETDALDIGPWDFVSSNNILFGANNLRMMKWTGANWQNWGIQTPANPPTGPVNVVGTLTATQGGWSWRYSYKNSVTGHVGTASAPSTSTGNVGPFAFQLTAAPPNPADGQVDTLIWWRNQDGGGNWNRVAEVVIATGVVTFNAATVTSTNTGPGYYQITDDTPDANLDFTTQAPLINDPPPLGKYLAVGQNRIFVANLESDPTLCAYSGLEQILTGSPAESFPPNNRFRLKFGAEGIAGIGVLPVGVTIFSNTKRMYVLRGSLEDITVTAPVSFNYFLQEMPWDIGTMDHHSIQPTPYGLIFWASDATIQIFDGVNNLYDISQTVYPILRRRTVGLESIARSAYFNWLERDWYALTFPIDGSGINNYLLLWALDKNNDNIDVFPCTIQCDSIGTITTSLGQRALYVGANGFLNNLPTAQVLTGGIADLSINPATNGKLQAYWRSGYFGNDNPYRMKTFRKGFAVTDQDPEGYQVTTRLVDASGNYPVTDPRVSRTRPLQKGGHFSVNYKAQRCSVEIKFDDADVDQSVLELNMSFIETADRP